MVGNVKRGFTDHNASGRSLILWSVITIADDNMQDQHFMYRRVWINSCTFNQFKMKKQWNVDLRLCFLTYTVQDARTVLYLDLYVSMDSLTLTLASFSQRYLAEAQDYINVLLEQMKMVTYQKMKVFIFIWIGVEFLETFCSVLFDSGNVIKYIILPILSGYLEWVLQVPQAHRFSIFEA